jgi:hypothetical protein
MCLVRDSWMHKNRQALFLFEQRFYRNEKLKYWSSRKAKRRRDAEDRWVERHHRSRHQRVVSNAGWPAMLFAMAETTANDRLFGVGEFQSRFSPFSTPANLVDNVFG